MPLLPDPGPVRKHRGRWRRGRGPRVPVNVGRSRGRGEPPHCHGTARRPSGSSARPWLGRSQTPRSRPTRSGGPAGRPGRDHVRKHSSEHGHPASFRRARSRCPRSPRGPRPPTPRDAARPRRPLGPTANGRYYPSKRTRRVPSVRNLPAIPGNIWASRPAFTLPSYISPQEKVESFRIFCTVQAAWASEGCLYARSSALRPPSSAPPEER